MSDGTRKRRNMGLSMPRTGHPRYILFSELCEPGSRLKELSGRLCVDVCDA